MRRRVRDFEGGALDPLEEAVYLVRRAPAGALAVYLAGVGPFLLVFLFFWGEMSMGPAGVSRLPEASLLVALAFLWMRYCQGLFSAALRRWIGGAGEEKSALAGGWRIFCHQAVLQALALFALPLSLLLIVAFPWVYSFFHCASAEVGRQDRLATLVRTAARHASHRLREHVFALAVLGLVALVLYVNTLFLIQLGPWFLRTFLGIETAVARGGWEMTNSTVQLTGAAVTYLALDPIVRALHVLRCFRSESRETGEDIRVALRMAKKSGGATGGGARARSVMAGAAFFLCLGLVPNPVEAADTMEAERATRVSPQALDTEIGQVLEQRQYRWRLPPPPAVIEEKEPGLIERFIRATGERIGAVFRSIGRTIDRFLQWLVDRLVRADRDRPTGDREPWDIAGAMQVVLLLLSGVLVLLIAVLVFRAWRRRRPVAASAVSELGDRAPDLTDETIQADALPVDEWTRLALEYKGKGEHRLALRAYYLGALARLAGEGAISLARYKSSRDYVRELARRSHDEAARVESFAVNTGEYEKAWYGMYPVDGDMLNRFEMNLANLWRHDVAA